MIEIVSLSEQIENVLKEEILTGVLSPGQRISIDELAAKWGVSTTPVRDAIKHLESVGFLKVAPRRGVFVADFGPRAFKNIFDLRIALECLAVESATELIPDDEIQRMLEAYKEAGKTLKETGDRSLLVQHDHLLHDLIVQHCDNEKLIEIMQDLSDLIEWAHRVVQARRADSYEQALPEHLRIIEALLARDVEAAREALRSHLKAAFDRTFNMLE